VSKKRDKKKRRNLCGHRAWLAMGTIAAYAAAGSGKAAIVYAQNTKSNPNGQAQLPVRRFDIAAGPLDVVIAQFEQACGVNVQFSVPTETVPGFKSPGVIGLYTQEQALKHLLVGTGLSFAITGQDQVTIGVKNAESIEVHGINTDTLALSKFPVPLLDLPQSVNAIPKEIMEQQGSTTLRDVLRNTPGISLAAGEGGSQGDNLTIRGFSARNDIFLDGMRDFGSYYRDPFNYEQVDMLEGPAGVQFGRGSTGGVINQETKTPQLRPFVNMDGAFGTDITRRFAADVNQPLPDLANGSAVRLNIMAHEANVAARDVVENRRFGIAPSLALGLQTPTRLNVGYFHFNENDIPDYGIPWYFNRPAAVARHNYYGFRENNFLKTDVDMATAKVDHEVNDHVLLRDQLRYARYKRDAQITEPQVNTKSSGTITPSTPLDQIQVNRNQIVTDSVESFLWDQADATVRGNLLGMKHTVVVGVEGGRETSSPIRTTYNNPNAVNTVPTTSLLNPDENQLFTGTPYISSNTHVTTWSGGGYLLDTVELSRQWQLSGAGRWDYFSADYNAANYTYPTSGGVTVQYPVFHQVVQQPTWRAALVYKPVPFGSIYFDAGTSFNPSAESLSLTQATAATPPEENHTYEFGSKWDLRGGRFTARGSLYRTQKENARETSPTDSTLVVLAGTQRVDGVEAAVQGHVTDRWELLSSYTYMHCEVVKSQFFPLSVGQPLANAPRNLFNLWSEYRLPHGFEIGGGGNFVDSRRASSTVPNDPTTNLPKQVPGYWAFNAMAKYQVTERITLQANVYNLFNRDYVDQIHPSHLVPGAGTSGLFGLKFKF